MVFHTIAFHKAAVSATLLPLQPIQDDCVTVAGNDLTVPSINQLVAALVFGNAPLLAQLQSPSLRRYIQEDIIRMIGSEVCENAEDSIVDLRSQPLILDVSEKLNALTQHTLDGWMLIWLADTAISPVKGDIHTIRGTLAVTTVPDVWQNCALTLTQTLPAGRYKVVGMRAYGTATMLAARLLFTGQAWRPGVPAKANCTSDEIKIFRKGNFGSFGEFEFDQPPQVEVLSTAATVAPIIALDIIQVRAGR